MDITHQKFISTSNWDPSLVMEDQIIHDHTSFEPFWPNYAYENNQLPCSDTPLPPTSAMLSDVIGNHHIEDAEEDEDEEELGAMKEMMFKIAAMQPVDIDPATIRKPKRRNVRISDDPQSVAAQHRRERISEKIRILQRLVPGGTKMDTASMLDEAIRYVKFLKRQIRQLQSNQPQPIGLPTCPPVPNWAVGSSRPLGLGTSTRVTTTMVAATIVGTSYSVGVDDHTMCINNNEVFHT